MGRWPSPTRKTLVEECQVISVSAALANPATNGIVFCQSRGAVAACGDGFVVPRAGGECSNSIGLLAQTSSLVANATISGTGACKNMISAWIGW